MNLDGGKLLKCRLMGKTCRKCTTGLNINDSEKNLTPEAHMPPPWGNNINVYYHNIQTFSSLKLLGQSKPNFI